MGQASGARGTEKGHEVDLGRVVFEFGFDVGHIRIVLPKDVQNLRAAVSTYRATVHV